MKRILMIISAAAIFAAPCAYDAFSQEPSPLATLFAVVMSADRAYQ